ncbi:MAG: hypothetical protein CVU68_00600 [Deltaproteobacteria bacterium HGW-Deltaproteobacteria-3]|nr:MAG: hypothetical protein CVU68_00600 [Deltaproteobacteria bacterium HGW-Deltaproteobacteria-3]
MVLIDIERAIVIINHYHRRLPPPMKTIMQVRAHRQSRGFTLREIISKILFTGLLSVLFCLFAAQAHAAPKKMPSFKLPSVDGGAILDSDKYKGQGMVVHFFLGPATGFNPVMLPPIFIALQKKYGPKGFTVIGILMDKANDTGPLTDVSLGYMAKVSEALKKKGVNYPVVMGDYATAKAFGASASSGYEERMGGQPDTYLIDRKGNVIIRYLFENDWDVNRWDGFAEIVTR